jgi:hypothetical protein
VGILISFMHRLLSMVVSFFVLGSNGDYGLL